MTVSDRVNSVITTVKDFWKDFDLKKLSEKIGGTSAEAVQAALYFGIFFGLGFFFKKHFKFLFATLVAAVIVIKILEYNQFAVVDWTAMQNLVGLGKPGDFNILMNSGLAWIKQNILIFVASIIGFLIGYKLG